MTTFLANKYVADLSRWNIETEPDFVEAKTAGLAGVIIKFSQGLSYTDSTAIQKMWDAYEAGVTLLGGYHFGDSSGPAQQAKYFLDAMKADFGGDLTDRLIMLDVEGNGGSTMTVPQAGMFVQAVFDDQGRWPVVYMGKYGPDGKGTGLPSRVLSNCDLVLPAYGNHPDLGPLLPAGFREPQSDTERHGCARLWQFTNGSINGGPVPGLGKIDQSRIIGFSSADALTNWWGH
jgi:GH25 family lysozyme M1 (1,4-beta-N-acetylmuramidase)